MNTIKQGNNCKKIYSNKEERDFELTYTGASSTINYTMLVTQNHVLFILLQPRQQQQQRNMENIKQCNNNKNRAISISMKCYDNNYNNDHHWINIKINRNSTSTEPVVVIGECLKNIAVLCTWIKPVKPFDLFIRLKPVFHIYIQSLRELSPCYCVLNKNMNACGNCKINIRNIENKKQFKTIKTLAMQHFYLTLINWPEFNLRNIELINSIYSFYYHMLN